MRKWRGSFVWVVLLALALHALPAMAEDMLAKPALVQIGVIDALLAGGYDGSVPVRALPRLGDVGLGTFDALDGELVLVDGVVFQVPANGQVRRVGTRRADARLTTPFAQVAKLKPGPALALPNGCGLKGMEAALDKALGDTGLFAAARVEATFATLRARSVPRQVRPYRPLAEVAKEQSVFEFTQVRGTLVGLRGPDYVRGLGVPGWHWHFLTSDRTRGGHVLDLTLESGQARFASLRRMELLLPERGLGGLDLAKDRRSELKAVESAVEIAVEIGR